MKYMSIVFILIMLSLSQAQDNYSKITIISSPTDAEIRINGVIVGTTPLENIRVDSGLISIEAIAKESGIWNTNNVKVSFYLSEAQDTTIKLNFPRFVQINSIPYHAKLIYEKDLLGLTPVSIDYNKYRGKELLLEKNGFKSFRFYLENNQPEIFNLAPIDISSDETENPSFAHSLLHSNVKSKFLFLTGTVVTHWMSFYFKNLADNNYDKYLSTGNPALMEKYWGNTQKYDRWSDITLGVSYAFLGGLIYTVLWR